MRYVVHDVVRGTRYVTGVMYRVQRVTFVVWSVEGSVSCV